MCCCFLSGSDVVLCLAGGHVDLRRLPDSLDPLRRGFCGVGLRLPGLSAHSRFCYPDAVGKVIGHVQPHHLPGGGPETLLHQVRLFQGPEGTQAFSEDQVLRCCLRRLFPS